MVINNGTSQTVLRYDFIIRMVIFWVWVQPEITKTKQPAVCMWQPAASLLGPSLVLVIMGPWQAVDEITGAHLYRHPEAHLRSWWGQRQTHTNTVVHTQAHKNNHADLHCLLLSIIVFSTHTHTMSRLEIFSEVIAPSSGHLLSLHFEGMLHTASTVSNMISGLSAIP